MAQVWVSKVTFYDLLVGSVVANIRPDRLDYYLIYKWLWRGVVRCIGISGLSR
jgi:hypothetical protein